MRTETDTNYVPTSRARTLHIAFVACVALATAVWGLSFLPPLASAAVVVLAAVVLWSTSALPEHVTALLFFLLVLLVGIAPPQVVLSGFESQALWLIIAGLVVGVAVKRTGLAERLASVLAARAGERYASVVTMIILIGLLLTFLMPSSMGRVVMLMPIVLALTGRLGYGDDSPGKVGLALAAVLGTYLPSAGVLPANLPNIILAASAEQLYGVRVSYAEYLVLAFPVLGLGKAIAIGLIVVTLFPDKRAVRVTGLAQPPWSPQEKAVAFVLAAALTLWMTDFLHGVSPAWVALAAAVVCMLPATGLFPVESFNRDLSFSSIFHAAGIIGLGAVVAHSGLGAEMGRWLVEASAFEPGRPLRNFMLLCAFSTLVCLVTTTPGLPAVLTPLSGRLAEASGLPLEVVFLSQIVGFANPLLPYQSAPIVFALTFSGIPIGHAIRAMLVLAALTLGILAPLSFFWWAAIRGMAT
jgi:di/tricarboxylate transporter